MLHDTLKIHRDNVHMIAHRGLSGLETENTCAAFVAAGNRSYFGVETDVHLTLDGQFIIIHDNDTARVGLDKVEIEHTTFDTLRQIQLLDVNGEKDRSDLRLPSLQEYIRICKKYQKYCVLEIKGEFPVEALERMVDLIQKDEWLDHVIFIAFDLENLIQLRKMLPDQPMQYLVSIDQEWDWITEQLLAYRLDVDAYYKMFTEERIRMLHEKGIKVNAWTVDKLENAQQLADWGIDYITSNIIE